jgi:hypothetical protein
MDGDENRFSEALRQGSIEVRPFGRQQMMRFIQNDPMRAARPRPHGLEVWKKLSEESRSISEWDAQQIDVQHDFGIFKKGIDLAYRYRVKLVAESEDVRHCSVIAFGIDNADSTRRSALSNLRRSHSL